MPLDNAVMVRSVAYLRSPMITACAVLGIQKHEHRLSEKPMLCGWRSPDQAVIDSST